MIKLPISPVAGNALPIGKTFARLTICIVAVVVVRLEEELVPEVGLSPVLEKLVMPPPLLRGRQPDQGLAQVRRPVRLAEARQDVGRREGDVISRPTTLRFPLRTSSTSNFALGFSIKKPNGWKRAPIESPC